jgi:hypothetical protein
MSDVLQRDADSVVTSAAQACVGLRHALMGELQPSILAEFANRLTEKTPNRRGCAIASKNSGGNASRGMNQPLDDRMAKAGREAMAPVGGGQALRETRG